MGIVARLWVSFDGDDQGFAAGSMRFDTRRPLSGSFLFLGLPSRILNINPKMELLRGLWVRVIHMLYYGPSTEAMCLRI